VKKVICAECKNELISKKNKFFCETEKCPNKDKQLVEQIYTLNGNTVYDTPRD
jgi:hypothetical protein